LEIQSVFNIGKHFYFRDEKYSNRDLFSIPNGFENTSLLKNRTLTHIWIEYVSPKRTLPFALFTEELLGLIVLKLRRKVAKAVPGYRPELLTLTEVCEEEEGDEFDSEIDNLVMELEHAGQSYFDLDQEQGESHEKEENDAGEPIWHEPDMEL
jgi:hypothetical protein